MRFEAAVALAVYSISSCLMIVLNKYVLSGHNFGLNFLLLAVQVSDAYFITEVCNVGHVARRAMRGRHCPG